MRSFLLRTVGRVPKWFKGTDCKSVIRRFESGRGLLPLAVISEFSNGCLFGGQINTLDIIAQRQQNNLYSCNNCRYFSAFIILSKCHRE